MPKNFSIKITDFKGIWQVMARVADGIDDDTEHLNYKEASIFNQICNQNKNAEQQGYFFYKEKFYDANGKETAHVPIPQKMSEEMTDNLSIKRTPSPKAIQEKNDIDLRHAQAMEMAKSVPEDTSKSVEDIKKMVAELADIDTDTDFWGRTIKEISDKYDIPPEILVTIIAIETGRKFKRPNEGSAGVMQITKITAKDMALRSETYEKFVNNDLASDTLYYENGQKRSASSIITNCKKDDAYCVKIGALCLAYKFKYPSNISKNSDNGTNKTKILNALGDYNVGRRDLYKKLAERYLERLNFDWELPFQKS